MITDEYKYTIKKSLGQNFLKDKNIAYIIVNSIDFKKSKIIIEIGPGLGILTKIIYEKNIPFKAIEIDKNIYNYLNNNYPFLRDNILNKNILNYDLNQIKNNPIGIISNMPYNISSQILFWIIKYKNIINQAVLMIQKEVGEKIITAPGNRNTNLLSVYINTFFNVKCIKHINNKVFYPKPKVNSTVIKLTRNNFNIDFNEKLYFEIIKTSFLQRRKMIKNSLYNYKNINIINHNLLMKRPEELTIEDYIYITNIIDNNVL
ncbi:MAG: ribosomal RNA small subunit methyltransferase A [Bacteroides sp.]|nr:MAG: ribosomal RNA small subunit methyltransferase A [Bacteroides sp.]